MKTLRKLKSDNEGAAVVEFALLAPLFILIFIGVIQIGIWLQNHNALRSLTADASRDVVVAYQRDNAIDDDQIRQIVLSQAVAPPYVLNPDRIDITIDRTGISRIVGAEEIDVRVDYQLSDFLPGVDVPLTTITYTRPIFVVDNTVPPAP